MSLVLFGLTGGIASGKSTVGRRWKARGVPVIDADQVARDAVKRGSIGLEQVIKEFGREFLTAENELDRKKLGALVFAEKSQLKKLEMLLWPHMESETQILCRVFENWGHKIACYEAAIIVEQGHSEKYKPLVVVTAPEEVRIERMTKRDGLSREQAILRIRAQATDAERESVASHIIRSDKPKEETQREADCVLEWIFHSFGVPLPDPALYE